jgi:hypothetical protein
MWVPIGRKRRGLGLCLLMGAILAFGVVGCGGGSGNSGGGGGGHTDSGTPAGVYTLAVTATSGTASHTMNVSVTVK